ncbi:MAG: hypothetical protein HOO18_05245, partial [Porticoccaceae bacterium]|nr:hypothetical protein [Porticoccaceae bacterium]
MKNTSILKLTTLSAAIIASSAVLPSVAFAEGAMVEEIVTTGTRAKARSATDTVAA